MKPGLYFLRGYETFMEYTAGPRKLTLQKTYNFLLAPSRVEFMTAPFAEVSGAVFILKWTCKGYYSTYFCGFSLP